MFAILKLLSFLPFGSLFRGGSLKIIGIVGMVIALGLVYWNWKKGIEEGVRDEVNVQLLEERLKEQERHTQNLLNISTRQNEIIEAAIERNDVLLKQVETGRIKIGSMKAKPASEPVESALDLIRDIEAKDAAAKAAQPKSEAEEKEESGNSVIDEWKKKLMGDKK